MNITTKAFISVLATTLVLSTAGAVATTAHAAEIVTSSQTTSSSKIIAQDQTDHMKVRQTGVGSITVTAPAKTKVMVSSKKFRQAKLASSAGTATFNNLTPGVTYTFAAAGQATKLRAIEATAPASNLTVFTTDEAGTVTLTWDHKTTLAQGDVNYEITAAPVQDTSMDLSQRASLTLTQVSRDQEFRLTGLNTDALYTFTVTPINALGAGKATSAIMTESLHALTGLTYTGTPAPVDTQKPVTPIVPVTPASTPAPAPGPAPKPATKTIYVCPDGYTEAVALCEQSTPYTFHSETETRGYSYHTEFIVTGWRVDPQPCSSGTAHPDGCHVALGYNTQVKDAAPAGWSDNGSSYTRTLEVKDAIPAGFSDNGSFWVKVTAKVAREVAA
jgi:hypothetical protein